MVQAEPIPALSWIKNWFFFVSALLLLNNNLKTSLYIVCIWNGCFSFLLTVAGSLSPKWMLDCWILRFPVLVLGKRCSRFGKRADAAVLSPPPLLLFHSTPSHNRICMLNCSRSARWTPPACWHWPPSLLRKSSRDLKRKTVQNTSRSWRNGNRSGHCWWKGREKWEKRPGRSLKPGKQQKPPFNLPCKDFCYVPWL